MSGLRGVKIFMVLFLVVLALALTPNIGHSAEKKIAFVRNGDIWTMNPDGSKQTPLIKTKQIETNPVWSPSGRTIAYITQKGIWVADKKGKKRKLVKKGHFEPSENLMFTPNGRSLAIIFTAKVGKPKDKSDPMFNFNGKSGMQLINIRTHKVKRIIFFKGDYHGSWLPMRGSFSTNGKKFVFDWFRVGLHLVNADGKKLIRLNPQKDEPIEYSSPVFTIDDRGVIAGYNDEAGSKGTGVVNVQLPDKTFKYMNLGNLPLTISRSPDGKNIIYDILNPDTELTDTWMADTEGQGARRLAENAATPSWQP